MSWEKSLWKNFKKEAGIRISKNDPNRSKSWKRRNIVLEWGDEEDGYQLQ